MKTISNAKLRRIISIYGGVSLLILHNSSQYLNSDDKNLHINFTNYCFVYYCKDISQCIKYFKKASSHEYVILLFYDFDKDKIQAIVSQFDQYQQIQAIFILHSSINNDNLEYKLNDDNDNKCSYKSGIKLVKNFRERESLVSSLQQVIIEIGHNVKDGGLFNICNSPEKALRDLRQELGSFVWTHTFRGL